MDLILRLDWLHHFTTYQIPTFLAYILIVTTLNIARYVAPLSTTVFLFCLRLALYDFDTGLLLIYEKVTRTKLVFVIRKLRIADNMLFGTPVGNFQGKSLFFCSER